jgi:hypothetical protein
MHRKQLNYFAQQYFLFYYILYVCGKIIVINITTNEKCSEDLMHNSVEKKKTIIPEEQNYEKCDLR